MVVSASVDNLLPRVIALRSALGADLFTTACLTMLVACLTHVDTMLVLGKPQAFF